MIVRLSQKLAKKIKAGPLSDMPLHENLCADWSRRHRGLDVHQEGLLLIFQRHPFEHLFHSLSNIVLGFTG